MTGRLSVAGIGLALAGKLMSTQIEASPAREVWMVSTLP